MIDQPYEVVQLENIYSPVPFGIGEQAIVRKVLVSQFPRFTLPRRQIFVCLSPRPYKDRIENEAAVLITDRHRTANATSSPLRNLCKGFLWWARREANPQPWDKERYRPCRGVCAIWCRPVPVHWFSEWTWTTRVDGSLLIRAGIGTILLLAFLGRVGLIDAADVGGPGMAGFIVMAAGISFAGWRALPLMALIVATYASGSAATLQGSGGGLSGEAFGSLMRFGEIAAIGGCRRFPCCGDRDCYSRWAPRAGGRGCYWRPLAESVSSAPIKLPCWQQDSA